MKKSLIIAAILTLSLASGCGGGKSSETQDGNAASTGNQSAQSDQSAQSGTADGQTSSNPIDFAQNASENVDMDAIDGSFLEVSDESNGSPKQELGVYEVSIKDAKKFELDGSDYVVFAIDFTNNSSVDMTFASAIDALAFQDGMQIAPAVLPEMPEGLDTTTTMQYVHSGETITVQKVFMLSDTTTPVELQVKAFYEDTDAVASQIFNLQ